MSADPPIICTLAQARAAKSTAIDAFGRIANVSGIGITRLEAGGYGLKVNLEAEPADGVVLPATIDGVTVRIAIVGRIKKQGA